MNDFLGDLFSFSISIAAIIGWIRFKKINPAFYPFIFIIWIGFINEILSYIIKQRGYTAFNNNIYVLIESLMITWQFKNWHLFDRSRKLFAILLICFLCIWLGEGFFIRGFVMNFIYFRIIYAFVIVLMSINMINRELIREKGNILKNSIFLLCLTFVFYFTYKVIFWSLLLYALKLSQQFPTALLAILSYVNLLCNLIYALTILWIPAKHRFSLPY